MIEKVSENLSSVFLYKEEELKEMNIGILKPRMFASFKFIIYFSQIKYGEGKIDYQIRWIDNKDNIEA